jgi:hypothetical protein
MREMEEREGREREERKGRRNETLLVDDSG